METDADAQISNPDSSSDNEIVEDVVSFDEEGNQISENQLKKQLQLSRQIQQRVEQ